MSIARWDEAKLATANLAAAAVGLTEAAIASLGGMDRFVDKGETVWIKPNIGWNRRPELAANTNPDVVGALVRHVPGRRRQDGQGGRSPLPSRPARPIATAASPRPWRAAGGRMVYLDEKRYKDMPLGGEFLKEWPVYLEVAEADSGDQRAHPQASRPDGVLHGHEELHGGDRRQSKRVAPEHGRLPGRHHPLHEAAGHRAGRGARPD